MISNKLKKTELEACEIGKRSNNLIIYNVEESTSSNVETRIEHVTKNEHLEVLETHRLGDRQQTMNHKKNLQRPLLVVFPHSYAANKILRSHRLLKENSAGPLSQIIIKPDSTPLQRDLRKKMIE